MDKDKANALNLIRKSQTMNGSEARAILKASDKGTPIMSKANNVKGWNYNKQFYSNPDFVRDKLTPKQ